MRPRLSARFLFAGIGLAACMAAALLLEGFYARAHTGSWISHDSTPVLLFFRHTHDETERRLQEANAQSGDVEITLTWNNTNDLDLHCIDPNGQHIYYATALSSRATLGTEAPVEGVLDVDQNRSRPYTTQPVEHIYWPHGRAPVGTYQVYVDHYSRHAPSDSTRYQVTVKEFGRIHTYTGVISHADHVETGLSKRVCEFTNGRPAFALFAVPAGFWRALLLMGAWAGIVAAALGAALLAGLHVFYRRVYRKRFLALRACAAIVGWAAAWSAVGGAIVQALTTLLPADFLKLYPTKAHALGLALLACWIGLALGGRVPHLKRGWAGFAGLLGGAVAGWTFMSVYLLSPRLGFGQPSLLPTGGGVAIGSLFPRLAETATTEAWARVAAAAIIGAAIGFVIALVVEPPPEPEEPMEYGDVSLDGMQPLSLRANRVGPTGKLRRAGSEPVRR